MPSPAGCTPRTEIKPGPPATKAGRKAVKREGRGVVKKDSEGGRKGGRKEGEEGRKEGRKEG